MKILVIDVGGTNVKILATDQVEPRKIASGPTLTPEQMVQDVKAAASDWAYDAVAIGYPGPVVNGSPLAEPFNLGQGWVGFDFAAHFGKPVKVLNDAAVQALGSYQGGRMLFLGLGTGLGSAMILDRVIMPMELAHLPYKKGALVRGLRRQARPGGARQEEVAQCGRRCRRPFEGGAGCG